MRPCECSCHEGEARPEAAMRIEPVPTHREPNPPEPEDLCPECFATFGVEVADQIGMAKAERIRRSHLN